MQESEHIKDLTANVRGHQLPGTGSRSPDGDDSHRAVPRYSIDPVTRSRRSDFATDVLANPWDFADEADLSPFPDELAGWTISSSTARTVGRRAF